MRMADEQQLVTDYLYRKYGADKMGKDSFSNRAFIPESLADNPAMLGGVFESLGRKRYANALAEFERIDPTVAASFRLQQPKGTTVDNWSQFRVFKDGLPPHMGDELSVSQRALEAYGLMSLGRTIDVDSPAAFHTFEAGMKAKYEAASAYFDRVVMRNEPMLKSEQFDAKAKFLVENGHAAFRGREILKRLQ